MRVPSNNFGLQPQQAMRIVQLATSETTRQFQLPQIPVDKDTPRRSTGAVPLCNTARSANPTEERNLVSAATEKFKKRPPRRIPRAAKLRGNPPSY
ncbi:hypothetical protein NL676_016673 [Syzygium grande]|nr:hypothetical protein NL676_016673 [Syzygium grande]